MEINKIADIETEEILDSMEKEYGDEEIKKEDIVANFDVDDMAGSLHGTVGKFWENIENNRNKVIGDLVEVSNELMQIKLQYKLPNRPCKFVMDLIKDFELYNKVVDEAYKYIMKQVELVREFNINEMVGEYKIFINNLLEEMVGYSATMGKERANKHSINMVREFIQLINSNQIYLSGASDDDYMYSDEIAPIYFTKSFNNFIQTNICKKYNEFAYAKYRHIIRSIHTKKESLDFIKQNIDKVLFVIEHNLDMGAAFDSSTLYQKSQANKLDIDFENIRDSVWAGDTYQFIVSLIYKETVDIVDSLSSFMGKLSLRDKYESDDEFVLGKNLFSYRKMSEAFDNKVLEASDDASSYYLNEIERRKNEFIKYFMGIGIGPERGVIPTRFTQFLGVVVSDSTYDVLRLYLDINFGIGLGNLNQLDTMDFIKVADFLKNSGYYINDFIRDMRDKLIKLWKIGRIGKDIDSFMKFLDRATREDDVRIKSSIIHNLMEDSEDTVGRMMLREGGSNIVGATRSAIDKVMQVANLEIKSKNDEKIYEAMAAILKFPLVLDAVIVDWNLKLHGFGRLRHMLEKTMTTRRGDYGPILRDIYSNLSYIGGNKVLSDGTNGLYGNIGELISDMREILSATRREKTGFSESVELAKLGNKIVTALYFFELVYLKPDAFSQTETLGQLAESGIVGEEFAGEDKFRKHPNIHIFDGFSPFSGYEFVSLADDDFNHYMVGLYTGCCQRIGGAGGSAAIDSFKNPLAGVLVLKKIGVSLGAGIVSQSYFHYVPEDNGFILDNVEINHGRVSELNKKIENGLDMAYRALNGRAKQLGFKYVYCGKSHNKLNPELFATKKIEKDPRYFTPNGGYTDFYTYDVLSLNSPDEEKMEEKMREKAREKSKEKVDNKENAQILQANELEEKLRSELEGFEHKPFMALRRAIRMFRNIVK